MLHCPSLVVLLALATAQLASAAAPSIPLASQTGPNYLSYTYVPQAYCDTKYGVNKKMILFTDGNDCFCGTKADMGPSDKACYVKGGTHSEQAICWSRQTSMSTSGCSTCSRTAGSPGTRDEKCQYTQIYGQIKRVKSSSPSSSTYYWEPTTGSDGCETLSPSEASKRPKAKKCKIPLAAGEAICTSRRDDTPGFAPRFDVPGTTGCAARCYDGYHLSPAEAWVTCCKTGYRANAKGVCSKSTDGKL